MTLSEKLTRLRGGRSYAEAARAADCTPPTVRQIESGERLDPSYRIIAGLARFYGVSVDWLVDDSREWPPAESTLDDKVVRAVHEALRPMSGLDSLSVDEQKIIEGLRARGIHSRCNGLGDLVYDAIEAVLAVWDAGHDSADVTHPQDDGSEGQLYQDVEGSLKRSGKKSG